MKELAITYAGVPYYDRTRLLQTGSVKPDGITINFQAHPYVGELFRLVAHGAEVDCAEMSLSTYILMVSRGDRRFVGLPVFPSRAFRHSQIYVNVDATIERPEDLRGRRIGVLDYQMTAALWIRAILQHDFGVLPSELHWMTGGLTSPEYTPRLEHDSPSGVRIDRIPPGEHLEGMLVAGGIDALISFAPARRFRDKYRSSMIRRLFPNYREVEMDYFRRTGFFPIMHMVVLKRELYDANPWVALSLMTAFQEAKVKSIERLMEQGTFAIMHPWMEDELVSLEETFNGDPFMYGFQPNAEILRAMTEYSYEQGLSERPVNPKELFAPETLEWSPISGL